MKPSRIISMLLILIIVLAVFVIRLMRYQLVEGVSYREQSEKTTLSKAAITAPRGEIVDRYGRRLATNRVGYTVVFNWSFFPKGKDESAAENSMILSLTKILAANGEQWDDTLPISAAPFKYASLNSGDIASLQSMLKINSKTDAGTALNMLCERYGISGYNDADKRTIAGIRYNMESYKFSANNNIYNFAGDVSVNSVTEISERNNEFPGVEINQNPIRTYPEGTIAPHIIGTVGPIYAEDYKTLKTKGYGMDGTIGRGGIEQSMEQYLRGIDGQKGVELNSEGKVISQSVESNPKPGDTVVLTLDSKLQAVLQNSLASTIQSIVSESGGDPEYGANAKSGAAVVLNIKTGEVLAAASYPSYDLNNYRKDYSALLKQDGDPLINRCVTGLYRPGSTFKPVVAVAALMSGAITNNTYFYCSGGLYRYGHYFHCDNAHGSQNVIGAIKESCNYFFYNAGDLAGIDKIDQTAEALGLGTATGIELPGEKKGILTSKKEREESGGQWYRGDTLQASIGQSDSIFTPLQLASYVATLVNGGVRYKVHIVDKVESYDNSKVYVDNTPHVVSDIKIPPQIVQTVKQGMREVTENGTAANAFRNYQMAVGGKTGTAQVPGGYNGVFIAFAPYDNPQIAVAAVVEHGYHGNQIAPLAKEVFNAYFFGQNNVSSPAKDNTLIK